MIASYFMKSGFHGSDLGIGVSLDPTMSTRIGPSDNGPVLNFGSEPFTTGLRVVNLWQCLPPTSHFWMRIC